METRSSSYTVAGSFGAQYSVAKHFGIFGEIGLQYGHNSISPPASLIQTERRRAATGRSPDAS